MGDHMKIIGLIIIFLLFGMATNWIIATLVAVALITTMMAIGGMVSTVEAQKQLAELQNPPEPPAKELTGAEAIVRETYALYFSYEQLEERRIALNMLWPMANRLKGSFGVEMRTNIMGLERELNQAFIDRATVGHE